MNEITLSQVCKKCGVTRRAVQGYEKHNLVHATGKTNRGYLLYDQQAQEKIKTIKMLQNFGFPVKEITVYQNADDNIKVEMLQTKLRQLIEKQKTIETNISSIEELIKSKKEKISNE